MGSFVVLHAQVVVFGEGFAKQLPGEQSKERRSPRHQIFAPKKERPPQKKTPQDNTDTPSMKRKRRRRGEATSCASQRGGEGRRRRGEGEEEEKEREERRRRRGRRRILAKGPEQYAPP
ncbi:hypothetical protein FOWG_03632 [Fusarium oxysporum f. sp. lycopersici MN25]|nr:hypothetical protein FOWG_03632 [Fusarium oxysporum f. sp. lycopersici MN25]